MERFAELEGQTSTSSHNGVMHIRFTAPPLTTRKIKSNIWKDDFHPSSSSDIAQQATGRRGQ